MHAVMAFVTHNNYLLYSPIWDTSPKSEPALELISRAAPSVEAHHHSVGPDAGKNFRGRWIKKDMYKMYNKVTNIWVEM